MNHWVSFFDTSGYIWIMYFGINENSLSLNINIFDITFCLKVSNMFFMNHARFPLTSGQLYIRAQTHDVECH